MGMTAPEGVGGAGADYVSYALSLMEIAAADGALSTIISIQNSLIVSGLLKDGSVEQQSRFLPALLSGGSIGALALIEAESGGVASAVRQRPQKVAGGAVLNGPETYSGRATSREQVCNKVRNSGVAGT